MDPQGRFFRICTIGFGAGGSGGRFGVQGSGFRAWVGVLGVESSSQHYATGA